MGQTNFKAARFDLSLFDWIMKVDLCFLNYSVIHREIAVVEYPARYAIYLIVRTGYFDHWVLRGPKRRARISSEISLRMGRLFALGMSKD